MKNPEFVLGRSCHHKDVMVVSKKYIFIRMPGNWFAFPFVENYEYHLFDAINAIDQDQFRNDLAERLP